VLDKDFWLGQALLMVTSYSYNIMQVYM